MSKLQEYLEYLTKKEKERVAKLYHNEIKNIDKKILEKEKSDLYDKLTELKLKKSSAPYTFKSIALKKNIKLNNIRDLAILEIQNMIKDLVKTIRG